MTVNVTQLVRIIYFSVNITGILFNKISNDTKFSEYITI